MYSKHKTIKGYLVAYYDNKLEDCFDETFYPSEKIDIAFGYVETLEDKNNYDRTKVYVLFNDGDVYELKMEKVERDNRL